MKIDKNYLYTAVGAYVYDIGVTREYYDYSDAHTSVGLIRQTNETTLSKDPYANPLTEVQVLYNSCNQKINGDDSSRLLAYYLSLVRSEDDSFSIYKKTPSSEYYQFVCDLASGSEFLDYNVKAKEYYHYLIAYKESGSSTYKMYEQVEVDNNYIQPAYSYINWDTWSICDILETQDEKIYVKDGDTWIFAYNMENRTVTQNNSVTSWDTLGKYPKYSIGKKDYESGSMSCMLGDIGTYSYYNHTTSCNSSTVTRELVSRYDYSERGSKTDKYSKESDKLEKWRGFVNNGNMKLLKDYKGNAWVVQITESPSYQVNMQTNLLQTQITFNWQEALDVDSISIVSSNAVATE